jgi:hypothetical protein
LTSKFGKLDECSMTSNMGQREDLLGCYNLVKILMGSITVLSETWVSGNMNVGSRYIWDMDIYNCDFHRKTFDICETLS